MSQQLRRLVPIVMGKIGSPAISDSWSGIDALLPLLERIRSEGGVVIIKFDGERNNDEGDFYTAAIVGQQMNGESIRIDAPTLEDALAFVIVAYARRFWNFDDAPSD
ncbi:MAG: hypothetical protein IPK82_09830 [Polyangiaceae bacterium]|nr:hypothetical protein [Polyangiaceae bacterium]